ncbi:hypothetical protein D9757_014379 [Collybiopsis confluens]|uniref:Ubiquitin-like protease family profile domain-containing protein n=1 Tax=Collybiopsis confluens TaxID=2823264 RepID=A0A8H5LIF6_9AGAR|nr:hypothetical protein D9757_014379 [Collybiopsis confluens]
MSMSMSPSLSARNMYQQLLSPSRRKRTHKKCIPVNCPPFGLSRSCTSPLLQQISDTVHSCKQLIPSLSLYQLLTSASIDQIDSIVDSEFSSTAATFSNRFFLDSKLHIKQLGDAARVLSIAGSIHVKINLLLKNHDALPSDNAALVALGNLMTLYECIIRKKLAVENDLWTALDDHPEATEAKLRALMAQDRLAVIPSREDSPISITLTSGPSVLGAGSTTKSSIISHLFKRGTSTPKDGYLTADDQTRVIAWCSDAVERLKLKSWDSVFIPINEDRQHWYSVHIDFSRKQINVYDSLGERYIQNCQKPPLLRRNASLMLILLWLTETLSTIRGEPIELQNKLGSGSISSPTPTTVACTCSGTSDMFWNSAM